MLHCSLPRISMRGNFGAPPAKGGRKAFFKDHSATRIGPLIAFGKTLQETSSDKTYAMYISCSNPAFERIVSFRMASDSKVVMSEHHHLARPIKCGGTLFNQSMALYKMCGLLEKISAMLLYSQKQTRGRSSLALFWYKTRQAISMMHGLVELLDCLDDHYHFVLSCVRAPWTWGFFIWFAPCFTCPM